MKSTYFIYLLCVSIIGVQGFLTIRDFKNDAVTRGTETTQKVSTISYFIFSILTKFKLRL